MRIIRVFHHIIEVKIIKLRQRAIHPLRVSGVYISELTNRLRVLHYADRHKRIPCNQNSRRNSN